MLLLLRPNSCRSSDAFREPRSGSVNADFSEIPHVCFPYEGGAWRGEIVEPRQESILTKSRNSKVNPACLGLNYSELLSVTPLCWLIVAHTLIKPDLPAAGPSTGARRPGLITWQASDASSNTWPSKETLELWRGSARWHPPGLILSRLSCRWRDKDLLTPRPYSPVWFQFLWNVDFETVKVFVERKLPFPPTNFPHKSEKKSSPHLFTSLSWFE